MHGLDLILARPSYLPVLRVLHHAGEALTGREIQRRTGYSNRATMLALEALVDCSAVLCEETAAAHWYRINPGNYLMLKALKPAFESEDLFWDDLRKTIRRVVKPRPIAAVATGPLARQDDVSSGRVELTLVFDGGRARIRGYPCMERLAEVLWSRYAVELQYNLVDGRTMEHEEYEPLWRRVARDGILLFGSLNE